MIKQELVSGLSSLSFFANENFETHGLMISQSVLQKIFTD